ncbi:MAG: hypothetical protein A2X61_14430 [Ignavibacteria bacterium GWB2_35_12]|nr:MAG: hypothetical protein A2X63_04570 [Ignavibacteria bacterium GWA2_35_8]OGU41100.1 MAG: hypothetical protein A2X61_14430 [Ignavibacteria bacterium GWB2_35_12]OGU94725.1 MAG: hypothetical protein A2220_04105 [Ignavibacteria bacterium RIFOXYA2_FULL_35_10]OGV22916.1 MAG: hypothetical protein A2475_10590 [Ignavibacteria bacterium RIFOXYC2_FULL_35_21]
MDRDKKKLYLSIIILLALGFLYLYLGSNFKLNIYDEAIGIYGAKRVAQGDLPYKDFWTLYAPGYFYFLAFLLNIIGWTISNERIISIIFMLIPPIFAFLIAKKYLKNNYAPWVFILIVIWTGYCSFYGKSIPIALGFGILSIFLAYLYNEKKKILYLIFSGITTGLTAYFRLEFGAYVFVSVILSMLIFTFLTIDKNDNKGCIGLLLKNIPFYTIFTILAFLPMALYLMLNVPMKDLYEQLIYAPSKIYPKVRSLPLPVPFLIGVDMSGYTKIRFIELFVDSIVFYFPLIVYIIIGLKLGLNVIKKEFNSNPHGFFIRLLLLISGIIFYSQASVRSEKEHLFSTMAIALILLVILFYESKKKFPKYIYIGLIIVSLLMPLENRAKMIYKSYFAKDTYWYKSHELKCICDSKQTAVNFENAINYIKNTVPINEKIFVGNYFHDRILLNDLMFYFLTDRDACTKYHELHPGVATTEKVQKEIVADFQKKDVKYIVLCENNEFVEPNKSSLSSGVFILDKHIHANFELHKKFGTYQIWKRKIN